MPLTRAASKPWSSPRTPTMSWPWLSSPSGSPHATSNAPSLGTDRPLGVSDHNGLVYTKRCKGRARIHAKSRLAGREAEFGAICSSVRMPQGDGGRHVDVFDLDHSLVRDYERFAR